MSGAEVPGFVKASELPRAEQSLAAAPASAEIAIPTEPIALAYEVSERRINRPMIAVARKTVCAKLSDDQFLFYWALCQKRGLDPFTQAYAFPASDGGLSFGLRIDGMRALAMATGQYESRSIETITSPTDKTKVIGARATIVRTGMKAPVVEEAYRSEYDSGKFLWATHPETMIRKVAESKALRAAFPDALAGLYEPAEIAPEAE